MQIVNLALPFFFVLITPLLLIVATFLLLVLYVTLDTGAAFTLIVVFYLFSALQKILQA